MRWLCIDVEGSAADRILDMPLAGEAAEDYVQAINEEDPSGMDERTVSIQEIDDQDRPLGEPRSFTVHVEISHTYSAYEN